LLFTNRPPEEIKSYLSTMSRVDFARVGSKATRTVTIPAGIVYSTGGLIPAEHDVPVSHTLEPELRRLGMPTRMVRGRVLLGDLDAGGVAEGAEGQGYTICKEGEVLDSRQTRLLKLFSICLSEFKVKIRAYWSTADGKVTEVDGMTADDKKAGDGDAEKMDGIDEEGEGNDDEDGENGE
jgi:mRNA turnover protein 4